MHQKQPPAKIAVLVAAGVGSAPCETKAATAKSEAKIFFII
jgi:hypothetical protein